MGQDIQFDVKTDQELELAKRRDEWLKKLCDEFRQAATILPLKMFPDGDSPQWTLNIERELHKVLLPVAGSQPFETEVTPKKVGAWLGHACVSSVWQMQYLANQLAEAQKKSSQDALQKLVPVLVMCQNFHQSMRSLATNALSSCIDQKYEYMSEFLSAFADAFSRKPKSFKGGDVMSASAEIHLFMLLNWRTVEAFESVDELHKLLIKTFGNNRAGSKKRVEKLCSRIGKTFPRKSGRPKKTAKIPTPS